MPRARSPPTYENWSRTGGISITIITAVTYTDSRLAATSPRIRLAVPVPTPTTPTQPHRPLPVHTSELPEEVPLVLLIRIATSIVLNTVVSPTYSYRSTNDHPLLSYLICPRWRVRRDRTRIIKIYLPWIAVIIYPYVRLANESLTFETYVTFIDWISSFLSSLLSPPPPTLFQNQFLSSRYNTANDKILLLVKRIRWRRKSLWDGNNWFWTFVRGKGRLCAWWMFSTVYHNLPISRSIPSSRQGSSWLVERLETTH